MLLLSSIFVLSLLAISSLISALETAVIASSPGRIQKKRSISNKKVSTLLTLLKNKDKVISTLLIIFSVVNTVATTIATSLIIDIVGDDLGTIIASAVMSVLIIVFAEVIPKAIAVSKPEKIALKGSNLINFAMRVMRPVNIALHFVLKIFCYIFRIDLKSEISATDEVRGVIEHFHQEGNVIKHDRDMLGGVLDLRHITVEEVMVHRSQIISLNADLSAEEIIAQAINTPYTRIPLWQGTKDNIIGILHLRNVLKALHKSKYDFKKLDITPYITAPWFVPENALLSRQLMEFKDRKSHMAIVVDEFGDIIGILTLEDILEEVVGQIDDELDIAPSKITKKGDRLYLVEGSATIRDINRELNSHLPDDDVHTIAGIFMHKLERLPNVGDKIEIQNLKLTIVKKQAHKIKQVQIEIIPQKEEETQNDQ